MIFQDIIHDVVSLCRNYPEILIFLSLAIGYYVGKIKVFGFSLGATASVLLAAILLGQMDVAVTPLIKTIAFGLFIFTIGYKVGPQFFSGLKKEGLNYIILSIFFAIIGLITAIWFGKLFGFDKGTTAGLLSGALTQSSVIGTAEGAIRNLSISAAQKTILTSNIAVAYAITYVFGVAGLIFFYRLVPKLLKIDLKGEAKQIEAELSGIKETQLSSDSFQWNMRPTIRVYRAVSKDLEGKKISDVETLFLNKVSVEKIKRGNQILEPTPDKRIYVGDLLLIIGERENIIGANHMIGPEVQDPILDSITPEMLRICVTKSIVTGKKLGEIHPYCKNCFVNKITRLGHELPLQKNTVIQKCDILYVIGLQSNVEKFAKAIGYIKRKTKITDLAMVGFGCFLGTLLGLATVKLGIVPLTLGVGGGVLLSGLFFGWLRFVHPTFGQFPDGAQWVLSDLGLNLFIACVGLTAGPRAVYALQIHGAKLFFAGAGLTLIPHILSMIFGYFVLKLNPVLLFGALTGAGTATPSLNVLKDECDSSAPALGYSVPYALGNFILTIWGAVIINFM